MPSVSLLREDSVKLRILMFTRASAAHHCHLVVQRGTAQSEVEWCDKALGKKNNHEWSWSIEVPSVPSSQWFHPHHTGRPGVAVSYWRSLAAHTQRLEMERDPPCLIREAALLDSKEMPGKRQRRLIGRQLWHTPTRTCQGCDAASSLILRKTPFVSRNNCKTWRAPHCICCANAESAAGLGCFRAWSSTCVRGRTFLSSNGPLLSRRVFSAPADVMVNTEESKRLPRGFQCTQPNLKYFKLNRIQLDKAAAGFILYVTDGVLLLLYQQLIRLFFRSSAHYRSFHLKPTGWSFWFSGFCWRTQSPFTTIRINPVTTGHPGSLAADIAQHWFIFTAAHCGFAIVILAATAFVQQISLSETYIIEINKCFFLLLNKYIHTF